MIIKNNGARAYTIGGVSLNPGDQKTVPDEYYDDIQGIIDLQLIGVPPVNTAAMTRRTTQSLFNSDGTLYGEVTSDGVVVVTGRINPFTVAAGQNYSFAMKEGDSVTLTGDATAVGVLTRQGAANVSIGVGVTTIGPFSGVQVMNLTTSAGSITAEVGDAVLGAAQVSSDGGIVPGSATAYPITNVTFATLPSAANYTGRICRVTDLNNALFESNGTRWKPVNGGAVIASLDTPITMTGTTETNLFRKMLPAGLLRNGDRLVLKMTAGKSGTVETAAMTIRMGSSATNGDAAISSATVLSAANQSYGLLYDLRRANATTVQKLGQGTTSTPYAGPSTPAIPAVINVVTNMDTTAFYYSVNWAMSATSEILTVVDATLELVSAAS